MLEGLALSNQPPHTHQRRQPSPGHRVSTRNHFTHSEAGRGVPRHSAQPAPPSGPQRAAASSYSIPSHPVPLRSALCHACRWRPAHARRPTRRRPTRRRRAPSPAPGGRWPPARPLPCGSPGSRRGSARPAERRRGAVGWRGAAGDQVGKGSPAPGPAGPRTQIAATSRGPSPATSEGGGRREGWTRGPSLRRLRGAPPPPGPVCRKAASGIGAGSTRNAQLLPPCAVCVPRRGAAALRA